MSGFATPFGHIRSVNLLRGISRNGQGVAANRSTGHGGPAESAGSRVELPEIVVSGQTGVADVIVEMFPEPPRGIVPEQDPHQSLPYHSGEEILRNG